MYLGQDQFRLPCMYLAVFVVVLFLLIRQIFFSVDSDISLYLSTPSSLLLGADSSIALFFSACEAHSYIVYQEQAC